MLRSGRRLCVTLTCAVVLLAGMPSPATADPAVAKLVSEVARTNVWVNASEYTPPVYDVTRSTAVCWQRVWASNGYHRLQARWRRVPLPCFFAPSAGSDSEAVIVNHGLGADDPRVKDYYELWLTRRGLLGWTARWGAGHDWGEIAGPASAPTSEDPSTYGAQASGLTFIDGLIRERDLRAGRIAHRVHMQVPYACPTWRAPAQRTDDKAVDNPLDKCLEYGTLFRLPADVPIAHLPKVPRLIAQAAKDHGLMVSDQNGEAVAFRVENWRRAWPPWSPGLLPTDPYASVGGHFGCDGHQNGQPLPPGAREYDCYPDKHNLFRDFPWDRLVEAN